jgi:hypothetical protein
MPSPPYTRGRDRQHMECLTLSQIQAKPDNLMTQTRSQMPRPSEYRTFRRYLQDEEMNEVGVLKCRKKDGKIREWGTSALFWYIANHYDSSKVSGDWQGPATKGVLRHPLRAGILSWSSSQDVSQLAADTQRLWRSSSTRQCGLEGTRLGELQSNRLGTDSSERF